MKIYKKVKRFCQVTGKELLPDNVLKEYRCDITGNVLDDDDYTYFLPSLKLDYGMSDPCCGCGDGEHEFSQDFGVHVHSFLLDDEYVWEIDYDGTSGDALVRALSNESKYTTIPEFLRETRIKTARKLIEDGVIEPWQLEGYEEDY